MILLGRFQNLDFITFGVYKFSALKYYIYGIVFHPVETVNTSQSYGWYNCIIIITIQD